jgi:hypothetical protein
MDIDVYHVAGWLLAVALTFHGLLRQRNRRLWPLIVIAGFVIAIGAGQHGGLAVIEPRWHEDRYLIAFVITSIGFVIWSLAFLFSRDRA